MGGKYIDMNTEEKAGGADGEYEEEKDIYQG